MSDDLIIGFQANTEKFQIDVEKAYKTVMNFGGKTVEAGAAIERAFNSLSRAANTASGEIGKSFNALNVKSDFGLGVIKEQLQRDKQAFQAQFEAIANSAQTSSRDVMRAFRGLNLAEANLNASSLKNEFQTLGIQSAASIEAAKIKIQNAFEEIKLSGTKSPQDIARAHEAMTAKITELDKLLVTSAQKAADEKKRAFKETKAAEMAAYAGQGMQESGAASKLIGQPLAGSSFSNNLKAQMEQAAAAAQLMQREMASYAAQAMAGETASAKLVGQIQAGAGFAAQLKTQMEEAAIATKKAADANAYATKNMGAKGDRLQGSFDTLGIKSSLNIEAEKAKIVAAFNQIKMSGVASANEVKQAMVAMKNKLEEVERVGGGNVAKNHAHSINLLSLASIAAIAKVQILYSLINQTMSFIGSLPSTAVDAIELFQSSMIKNAAIITSMQGGVKDLGKEYLKNRDYSEAVQNALVKMDAHTIASYSQLQLMNDAFVLQGVYIDINNKKQLDGYQNMANALATISAGMANPDMQFSQEIRGLMNMEDKPTNTLFRTLKGVDPLLKEHLGEWKKIAAETGNAGYVLEKLGPLLVGFAAASGDIDSLWSTIKSTMSTIRDQILRGGLKDGFGEIVAQMKELNKYAEANKEKIQAFLKEGFADAKVAVKFIWDMRDGFILLGKAALYTSIIVGISSVIDKIKLMDTTFKAGALYKALSNPATIAVIGTIYGGSKIVGRANELQDYKADAERATKIANSSSGKMFGNGPAFDAANMEAFQKEFPLDGPELLALARNKGAASLVPDKLAGTNVYKLVMDLEKIKKLKEGISQVITPKAPTGAAGDDDLKNNETSANSKLLAYTNAYNERLEVESKIANEKLTRINEKKYSEGLLSLQNYLDEKQRIVIEAAKEEVDLEQATYNAALDNQIEAYSNKITNKKGVRNLDAEKSAQLSADTAAEVAAKALIQAKGKLAKIEDESAASNKKVTVESIRGYQEQQAQFLEMQNNFVVADAVRNQLATTSVQYLQLQADALSGNEDAVKALAAANAQLAMNSQEAVYKTTEQWASGASYIEDMVGNVVAATEYRHELEKQSVAYTTLAKEGGVAFAMTKKLMELEKLKARQDQENALAYIENRNKVDAANITADEQNLKGVSFSAIDADTEAQKIAIVAKYEEERKGIQDKIELLQTGNNIEMEGITSIRDAQIAATTAAHEVAMAAIITENKTRYANQPELLAIANEAAINANKEFQSKSIASATAAEAKIGAIKEKSAKNSTAIISALDKTLQLTFKKQANETLSAEQRATKDKIDLAANYVGTAGNLFSSLADTQDQTSRRGFEAAKSFNLAATIMNTAAAIMAQLTIPGPVGWAGAALAAVTGAIQIAKISSTSYGGGSGSVSAPSGSFGGGSGSAGGSEVGSSRGAAYMSVQESQSAASMQKLADSVDNASIAMTKVSDGLIKFSGMFSGESEQLTLGGINGRYTELGSDRSPLGSLVKGMETSIFGAFSYTKKLLSGDFQSVWKSTSQMLGLTSFFGFGNKYKPTGSGVSLGIEGGEFEGQGYTDYTKKGGWFKSDKSRTTYGDLNAGFEQLMLESIQAITQTVQSSAIMMATKSNISSVNIPDMKIATAGRSIEDIQKDVEAWLQSVGNAYAKTVDGLAAFAAPGEEAFAVLVRLTVALQSTNEAFALVGKTLYASTLTGANEASKLQDLFGGTEKFNTKMDAYFTSMYTSAEQSLMKAAAASRNVDIVFATEAFRGIAKPETIAAFNALRNSITDPALFTALTEIGPAFAEMMKSATEAAEKISMTFIDNATSAADALKTILTGNLTTNNAFEIYRQQQIAFDNALAKGQDVSQIGQELLEASRVLFASGSRYTSDFTKVRDALADQAGLEGEVTLDSVGQQLVLLSGLKQATEDGTAKLIDSIAELKKEIQNLRIQQGLEAKSIVDATDGVAGALVAGVRN